MPAVRLWEPVQMETRQVALKAFYYFPVQINAEFHKHALPFIIQYMKTIIGE